LPVIAGFYERLPFVGGGYVWVSRAAFESSAGRRKARDQHRENRGEKDPVKGAGSAD
jgi:hypothetical protein